MYYKQYVCEVVSKENKELLYKTIIRALTIDEAEDNAIKDYNDKFNDNFYDPDNMCVKVRLITDWVDSNSGE